MWAGYAWMARKIIGSAEKTADGFRALPDEALRLKQVLMRHGAGLVASMERGELYFRAWAGALMILLALVLLIFMMSGLT